MIFLQTFSLPLAKHAVKLPSSQCQHFHVLEAIVAAVEPAPTVVVDVVEDEVKKYFSISSNEEKSDLKYLKCILIFIEMKSNLM